MQVSISWIGQQATEAGTHKEKVFFCLSVSKYALSIVFHLFYLIMYFILFSRNILFIIYKNKFSIAKEKYL